jgi:hypothetical protein
MVQQWTQMKQENYQTEASPVATKSWIQMCSLIFTFVDWQLIDATTFSCSNNSNSNQINSSAIIEKLEIHKVKIDQNICCIHHIQIPMQISEKKNWKINNYLSSQDLNCLQRNQPKLNESKSQELESPNKSNIALQNFKKWNRQQ